MSLAPRFGHSLTSKKSFQSPNGRHTNQSSPRPGPFLIQFSQILLGYLFIDTNLISLWLSGLLTRGNLLNTWLSPVNTLSSDQTWSQVISCHNLVTILLHSDPGPLESVTLLNTTLAPHDTMRDIRDSVMCDATRRRVIDQYAVLLQNLVCIIIPDINNKTRLCLDFIHFLLWYIFFMILHYRST